MWTWLLCAAWFSAPWQSVQSSREPGLVLEFKSAGGEARDQRVTRMVALAVRESEAPSPFLEPGPFEATFEGFLRIDVLDDYEFTAEGNGTLEVELDGRHRWTNLPGESLAATPPFVVELDQGEHTLRVLYRSPPLGDALLRLSWSSFDFTAEPVSPPFLSHDPGAPGLRAASVRREVREELGTRHCVSCHPIDAEAVTRGPLVAKLHETGMPETYEQAPSLTSAGVRYHPSWLARWIESPVHWRADARMPRLFHQRRGNGAVDSRALDIATYLKAKAEVDADEAEEMNSTIHGHEDEGWRLFHELGCLACHVTHGEERMVPPNRDFPRAERLSLHRLAEKWQPAALTAYLQNPRRFQPDSGMPDFRLNQAEAGHLAAFLLERSVPESEPLDFTGASAVRGGKLLRTTGCLACHEHAEDEDASRSLALGGEDEVLLDSGCLSPLPADGVPDFRWSDDQRRAIQRDFLAAWGSLGVRSDVEYAERQITRRRCLHCHESDGVQDVWKRLHGGDRFAESVAQMRPPLTWAGEKLNAEYVAAVVEGRAGQVARPWLSARMPGFAVDGSALAAGLALRHGRLPGWGVEGPGAGTTGVDAGSPSPPSERLAIGERLLSANGGMACVTCHDLGDQAATSVFDSRGPDLLGFPERLRADFYLRWMMSPLRYTPGTKMPGFAEDGRSSITDVLNGDAEEQFRAMWEYLVATCEGTR